MVVCQDITKALDAEPHKDKVCECVDKLGAVERDVVILWRSHYPLAPEYQGMEEG